jgi:hypothetical protein
MKVNKYLLSLLLMGLLGCVDKGDESVDAKSKTKAAKKDASTQTERKREREISADEEEESSSKKSKKASESVEELAETLRDNGATFVRTGEAGRPGFPRQKGEKIDRLVVFFGGGSPQSKTGFSASINIERDGKAYVVRVLRPMSESAPFLNFQISSEDKLEEDSCYHLVIAANSKEEAEEIMSKLPDCAWMYDEQDGCVRAKTTDIAKAKAWKGVFKQEDGSYLHNAKVFRTGLDPRALVVGFVVDPCDNLAGFEDLLKALKKMGMKFKELIFASDLRYDVNTEKNAPRYNAKFNPKHQTPMSTKKKKAIREVYNSVFGKAEESDDDSRS